MKKLHNIRIIIDKSAKPKLKRSTLVIVLKTLMLFPYIIIASILGAIINYESTLLTIISTILCFAFTLFDVVTYVKRWERKHMKDAVLFMDWHPNGWVLGTIQLKTGEIININMNAFINNGADDAYHEDGVLSILNNRTQIEHNGQIINCGFAIYGDCVLYRSLHNLGFNIKYIETDEIDVDID